MRIRHLIWKLFGTPDLPPRNFKLKSKYNQYTKKFYFPRSYKMASMYRFGYNIEDVANVFNVTRERVRQCIWKAYRENEINNGK